MDSLGSWDRARSRQLGIASYGLLYMTLNQLLSAGVSAIIESNFTRGIADRELRSYQERARILQIHCHASRDETRHRYRERGQSGERHPGHLDNDPLTLADFEASLDSKRHEPLHLDAPTISVDTTAGGTPDLATILRLIDALLGIAAV